MSFVFRHGTLPDINDPWQSWVSNMYNPQSTTLENTIKTILYFKLRTEEVCGFIPNEVWNIIVWTTFESTYIDMRPCNYTPKIWSHNLFMWLVYWISNQRNMQCNPLLIVPNTFDLIKPCHIKEKYKFDGVGLILKRSETCNSHGVRPHCVLFELPYTGYILGISFRKYDIANIKYCHLVLTNNNAIALDYIFIPEHKIDSTYLTRLDDDQEQYIFWKNPTLPVIPMNILSFMKANVLVEVDDNCNIFPPSNIAILCYYPDTTHLQPQSFIYDFDKGDESSCLFSGGTLTLVKKNSSGVV